MRWARVLAIGALLASAGCASEPTTAAPATAPATATPTAEPRLRVLLAGDSITEGYYASTAATSFAELLLAGWDAEGVRAQEAGARGWRIARAVEAMDDDDLAVDVAVLEVGANDVGKTPVREYAGDYRDLVVAAERGGPELVVCLGPWNDGARSAAYDRVVARICDTDQHPGRVHAELADLYDRPTLHGPVGAPTAWGPRDYFHPNNEGHAAIAERVALVVEEFVQP